ncbi:MAG: S-adenosyl-methyltransferase MraW [Limisphaerales bacterium]|nr:MAG: S-adenosyl-methyltransferase MraW [Limisphaerales bacterium]KAG0510182.1 MAG: S-adenosyl-methyltransferase MraW [Limisphaerales bacterium]TXT51935.1 MAG: S-adenosyl-methyltransferase MraW [Limisphaerales bacterium]
MASCVPLSLRICRVKNTLPRILTDFALPSPDNPTPRPPHRRRPRYSGRNPRRFEEKYKELDPQRYAETVAKVLASGKTPAGTHRPIMVAEILLVLAPQPGELAVDCTLGYGGHARELLARLQPGGHLLGLDADPVELPKTEARLREAGFGTETFTAVRSNFAGLPQALAQFASRRRREESHLSSDPRPQTPDPIQLETPHVVSYAAGADCILADLGVSSMQIDDPTRGFSTKGDGPLDMRMNPQRGQSASALLAKTLPAALADLLHANADEPRATELAVALARHTFTTTRELVTAIRAALPTMHKGEADLTVRRVFQALRIAVNDEFSALDTLLRHLPACLNPGGRVAMLTFHSGEDRRVKKAFEAGQREGTYAEISPEVIRPTAEERRDNPRSSPAKLRWARRAG